MTIRPFAAGDAEPIDELLRILWGHDPAMLAQYRWHRDWQDGTERLRRTLVAAVDSTPVGAGTLFESAIHPRMPFVIVNVAAGWQRRGIGSALFAALRGLGDGRPWLAKTTRRDRAGSAFLARRDFRPIVSTLTRLLDPRHDAVRAWLAGLPAAVPPFRLIRFDDPGGTASLAEVALVLAAVYRQFHMWNPPVEEGAEGALTRFCGPNLIAGSLLCAYAGDQLVGAANLIANPFDPAAGEAYLVNVSVAGADRPGAHELTAALIRHSLAFAAERGLRVRFEADDTYVPHRALFERAPAVEVDRDFVIMANG